MPSPASLRPRPFSWLLLPARSLTRHSSCARRLLACRPCRSPWRPFPCRRPAAALPSCSPGTCLCFYIVRTCIVGGGRKRRASHPPAPALSPPCCAPVLLLPIGRRWFALPPPPTRHPPHSTYLFTRGVFELVNRCSPAPLPWASSAASRGHAPGGGGAPPTLTPLAPPPGTWQRASPAAPLPLSPSPLSHLSHAQVALGAFSLEYKTMPSSRRRLPWAPSARLPLSSSCLSPHSPASAGGPMRPHARHRRMPLTWCSVGCLVAPGLPRPARPMLSAIMGYMFTCSQHHRLAPPLCSTPLPRAGSLCPRPQRHLGFARI